MDAIGQNGTNAGESTAGEIKEEHLEMGVAVVRLVASWKYPPTRHSQRLLVKNPDTRLFERWRYVGGAGCCTTKPRAGGENKGWFPWKIEKVRYYVVHAGRVATGSTTSWRNEASWVELASKGAWRNSFMNFVASCLTFLRAWESWMGKGAIPVVHIQGVGK